MKDIVCCVIGTIAFAITMKVPKKTIIYVAIGGIISASLQWKMESYYSEFFSLLIAMICLTLYCEIMARILKVPTTIILMPSTIPLLPGSSIYYTMFFAIQGETKNFIQYGKSTLFACLAIGLGAVISSTLIKISKKQIKNI